MKVLATLKPGHPKRQMNIGKYAIKELEPRVIELDDSEKEIVKSPEVVHWFIISDPSKETQKETKKVSKDILN